VGPCSSYLKDDGVWVALVGFDSIIFPLPLVFSRLYDRWDLLMRARGSRSSAWCAKAAHNNNDGPRIYGIFSSVGHSTCTLICLWHSDPFLSNCRILYSGYNVKMIFA